MFTENFDYQDLRRDFLSGILESELLGKTVYAEIIESGYAAKVSTPQMYAAIRYSIDLIIPFSRDIMMRWAYPLSPDNFSHIEDTHAHAIHNIYKGNGLSLERSVQLLEAVIVGSGTAIHNNSVISHSVIGRNCVIGSNVKIEQ